MKRILALILAGTMLFAFTGRNFRGEFSDYLDEFVAESFYDDYLNLHYSMKDPEAYGVIIPEPGYGSFPTGRTLLPKLPLNYLRGYADYEKTEEEQLCYDILEFYCELSADYRDSYLYYEPLDALRGIPSNIPVTLAEFRFETKDDIEDYFTVLKDTGRYFDDLLKFEEMRAKKGYFISSDELDMVIKQCRDFVAVPEENLLLTSFAPRLKEMGLPADEITDYYNTNVNLVYEHIIPAYESLADRLDEDFRDKCVSTAAICDFPGGQDYYRYLLTAKVGGDRTPEEYEELAMEKLKSYIGEQRELAEKNPNLARMYQDFEFPSATPEETLDFFKNKMEGTYPAPPSDVYRLEFVDPTLEESTSPAFYMIPPIDDPDANVIYLNRAERYANESLFLTLAHEGYPGHLYQITTFQNSEPHPIRWILSNLGYEEGWATAAEQWAWEQSGADEDFIRFGQLQELVSLAIHTLGDLYVNYDGENAKYIYKQLSFAGVSEDYAKRLERFCKTYELEAMPYYLGYLETEDILSEAKAIVKGFATDEEIYERYLEIGPAPFTAVRRVMLEWAEETASAEAAKIPA